MLLYDVIKLHLKNVKSTPHILTLVTLQSLNPSLTLLFVFESYAKFTENASEKVVGA